MVVELTCPARMWTKSRTQLWRVVLAPHWTYRHGGAEFLRLSALLRIDLRWSVTCAEAVATSPDMKDRTAGGIATAMKSGEGMVVELTGPGRVWTQSRNPNGLIGWLTTVLPFTRA